MTLLLLSVTMLLAASAPSAGPISKLVLAETPSEALGGRLTVRLPPGATAESRGHSIMSADIPAENETRFVLEAGGARIVLMVSDVFATAGAGIVESAKSDVEKWQKKAGESMRVEPLVLAGGIHAAQVTPSKLLCDDDACFVEGAYLETAEGEVEYAALYVNAAGVGESEAVRALGAKILASIAAGPKTLPLDAGERALLGFGERGALSATLPKNTAVQLERGPDFNVVRLHLLKPLGAQPSTLGVYVGGFPSFHPGKATASRETTLLGVKTAWFDSRDTGKKVRSEEALVSFKEEEDSPFVHLFATGDEADLPALEALAASLHFAPRPDAGGRKKK